MHASWDDNWCDVISVVRSVLAVVQNSWSELNHHDHERPESMIILHDRNGVGEGRERRGRAEGYNKINYNYHYRFSIGYHRQCISQLTV